MQFLLLFFISVYSLCNSNDKHIYHRIGHTFSTQFRGFGGLSVSRDAFQLQVESKTSLSSPCAACYADAYICGWDNCKWNCVTENESCTKCLLDSKCIENCAKCTGF